ncbi:uncharacterized protein LOC108924370 [Scleropages formosus]|uniref:uncharacterized protein LOC108924370 n=1 Tax=Scleropages formosus TaxID=113540 RepID=UPI000878FC23|nr:uncharacterized protein LOC108924370 [Scleropages formosus]
MSARRGPHHQESNHAVPAVRLPDRTPLRPLRCGPAAVQVSLSPGTELLSCGVNMKAEMGKHTLDPMVVNGTVIPGEDEDHFKENVPDVQKVILECLSLKKLALSHDGVCVMAGGQDGEREQGGEAERSDGMTDEESAVSEDSTDGRCDNDGVGHITLKSFICTGVDIEIPDNTRFSEDTVILLAEDHAAENHWSSALESENLGNFEDFILSSNSMKHEDHNYGQVEKFMINAESSQLGFEPLPDLNESEANAPENRVEISSENPSEFPMSPAVQLRL